MDDGQIEAVYRAARNLVQASSGVRLYDFQREIFKRVLTSILNGEGSEIVIEVARQAGKTEVIADVAFACTLLLPELFPDKWPKGFRVGIYAPTLEQSRDIMFVRLKDRFDREVLRLVGVGVTTANGNTFQLTNGSIVRSLTASPEAKKEGHTWDLLVVDESQDVETDVLKKSLFPMVTATGGPRIMIGTPTGQARYFFEALSRLKGSRDAFIFDVDRVIEDRQRMFNATEDIRHLYYEKAFRRELKRRGRDDSIRSQYYLEWILGTSTFCTAEQLLGCALPYERTKDFDYPVYAGWDIAKERDRSVLTIMSLHAPRDMVIHHGGPMKYEVKVGEMVWDEAVERYHSFVLDWVQWEGDDYPAQVADVVSVLRHYPKLENLTIDETGVGGGPRDMLKLTEIGGRVNPFNFGGGGQKISDLYTEYQLVLPNRNTFHFPMGVDWVRRHGPGFGGELDVETRHFIEESLGAIKTYRGQLLKVQHPDGDRYHDDYVTSAALANWGVRNIAGVKISIIMDPNAPKDKPRVLTVDNLFIDNVLMGVEKEAEENAKFEGKQRLAEHFKGT